MATKRAIFKIVGMLGFIGMLAIIGLIFYFVFRGQINQKEIIPSKY